MTKDSELMKQAVQIGKLSHSLSRLYELALRWGCSPEYWTADNRAVLDNAKSLLEGMGLR